MPTKEVGKERKCVIVKAKRGKYFRKKEGMLNIAEKLN